MQDDFERKDVTRRGSWNNARTLGRTYAFGLMMTTAVVAINALPHLAHAQSAGVGAKTTFNIGAQPLVQALLQFSNTTGIQLFFNADLTRGINSAGAVGSLTRTQALDRILAGSGLRYKFTNPSTVAIERPGASAAGGVHLEGAIQLDTINVAGSGISGPETPYETPAPTSYISRETVDRFRGSSPADIFRGTPGVMSGEARNGAGGIDVNIRGMQGMGRVATTVDGAENGVTIYQGYQGISNRTFVDPDLLGGVDITKGSDAASRGIAGNVAMRTLDAGDIVKPGEKLGIQFKTGFGTNTSSPQGGAKGGYLWPSAPWSAPNFPIASNTGMNRPGLLDPTSGSGSVVVAWKDENFDLLAGYAYRNQGNYHAGTNGPSARPVNAGPQQFCFSPGNCPSGSFYQWNPYFDNSGIANYRAGEEVLNTQLETQSWLAKGTMRFGDGQSLQLGYTGFRSEAGDIMASRLQSERTQAVQQNQGDSTKLDTGTLQYRWKPSDNALVDLKANLWLTGLELRYPMRGAGTVKPPDLGLPWDFRTGSDTIMWGGDITNKSTLPLDRYGSLDLTYGMSYLRESTQPSEYSQILEGWLNMRNGSREEAAAFAKAAYKPVDWLTFNGGLRYQHYWSHDRGNDANYPNPEPSRDAGGFSPSVGVTLEPIQGVQFYANYSNALRMPTLIETLSAFTLTVNPALRPERSSNWEIGTNLRKDSLLVENDKAMLKFGYFNWDVKDYVAREWTQIDPINNPTYMGLMIHNIARAKFSGLEFSSRYETGGFTADLSANYSLGVEFCQTAGTCSNSSLYADYGTNQVPPKYSVNLTLSQKLLDDKLTVGGRVSRVGPRAAGHGSVTAQGLGQFIALIDWKPYTLVDVFADYKLTDDLTIWGRIENLTDAYYVDPLGLVDEPGPGRTFRFGVTGKLGSQKPLSLASLADRFDDAKRGAGWTGFYVGGQAGYDFAQFGGTATAIDGTTAIGYPDPRRESPRSDLQGFSFGVQAGYSYQFHNRVVAGLEADISRTQISGYQDTYATDVPASNQQFGPLLASRLNNELNWLSTVRGRLGYAISDKLMLYATAGAAFTEQTADRTQYMLETASSTSTVPAFMESVSRSRVGYALGGGAEYALGNNWSLKGEYLLARFGQKAMAFPDARAGVMPDVTTPAHLDLTRPECFNWPQPSSCTIPASTTPGTYPKNTGRNILSKISIPMIKVGLNYRF